MIPADVTGETLDLARGAMSPTDDALDLVRGERRRQDEKWGPSRHLGMRTWLTILMEELGEVARADLEGEATHRLVEELSQVAAVAVAAIEDLLSRNEDPSWIVRPAIQDDGRDGEREEAPLVRSMRATGEEDWPGPGG